MKNNKKILVIGYFGYKNNQLDGQTIKTRSIYTILKQYSNDIIYPIDTQQLHGKKLFPLLKFIKRLFFAKKIVIIPAGNALKYIFPICCLFTFFKSLDIIMIPVGGWLSWYIEDHKLLKSLLFKTKIILPQTMKEVNNLKNKGYNVEYFPNFRITNFIPNIKVVSNRFKIVFFARIHKMKGLDIIFKLANMIKNSNMNNISIDFYGQIEPDHKDYFMNGIKGYNFMHYKGYLKSPNIYPTLQNYDVLLFPTQYINDEGFPGSILDCYIAGVPVIASNWQHADEFVSDKESGLICAYDKVDEFYSAIMKLYSDKIFLSKLKKGALNESVKYSESSAYDIIKKYL